MKNEGTTGLLEQKTYHYDKEYPDRMIQFDNNTIKYDELGNPTHYGKWTMEWEQGRKLVELSSGTDNIIRYKYDDRNRIAKIVNGIETSYQYIGGKVYKQWDKKNNMIFHMDRNCDYLGFTLNGQKYQYVKNLLGDVIAVEDVNGKNICSYEYDPWGNCVITGDMQIGCMNPIRYRGYYFDNETGFYYLGSRYYNPETERFINADEYSLCIDNNQNMYKYCENNPMYYIDSKGFFAMQNSHVIEYVKDQVYYYINNKVDNIPTDVKYLIATVDGEAEGENGYCRKAVACAIVNRCQQRYFSDGSFQDTVSRASQYSSYKGPLYQKCMRYLNSRDGSSQLYENIITTSLKVAYRIVSDSTSDRVLFYSPQSMEDGLPPKTWNFSKLKEVTVNGVDKNKFRFFNLN
ncbi:RHS repeat domain-containing protein [[Clostridium] polysaccharolyticum]|uniref:RHS repeat-associated core domain-containing protein n=1 Tax=[Clostridium] polysaccharolyticum TaxID=29364 RepID=A0A1H9YSM3_9FIRM|nr:RHS repeat-associated core domain-containing protein [[Clostridium] polysaccharolyticum]SES72127.1 RHS repeat-associated core domain-containing protein [[Clostridium] polysaccharolyticum]